MSYFRLGSAFKMCLVKHIRAKRPILPQTMLKSTMCVLCVCYGCRFPLSIADKTKLVSHSVVETFKPNYIFHCLTTLLL